MFDSNVGGTPSTVIAIRRPIVAWRRTVRHGPGGLVRPAFSGSGFPHLEPFSTIVLTGT